MIGYSQQIVRANRDADSRNTGVKLGRFCIARGIPVTDVMDFFGVSKQCVAPGPIAERGATIAAR